jgi:hypothetical protein
MSKLFYFNSRGDKMTDNVKHPAHYADTVPGIECIQVTRWMNFCRGSAVKYLWRAGIKDKSKEIEDLRKAIEFIEFEIDRLEKLENYTK